MALGERGRELGLNDSVDPDKVETLARTVGTDWKSVLIPDRVQQLTKDNVVSDTARAIRTDLGKFGILVEDAFDANLILPGEPTAAITAKQVADQKALEAANVTKQREEEAKQAVATARGQAESNRILTASPRQSPELLQIRLAEERTTMPTRPARRSCGRSARAGRTCSSAVCPAPGRGRSVEG